MSDSQRLYQSFRQLFESELAREDDRHLDVLARAITGLLLQKTIHLPAWAACLPESGDAASREQRLRRWLSNRNIDVRRLYKPFITAALAGWRDRTLYMALDTTSVADRLVIVRTALIYRGRAVPLAWQVFKRRSVMLRFTQYEGLLRDTAQLLPRGTTVVLLADRGFRDVRLMALLRLFSWHFRIRLVSNEFVSFGRHPAVPLDTWSLVPYRPVYLQAVRLTAQRYGPVNIALGWDGDPQHDPWRIASDQRAGRQTLADYALRMGIDLGFLDDKSAGFQLEDSELLLPDRLNHLLLVMALGTLYLVSLGTSVVAAGQRPLVDSHWQRGLSYLQLGWRWLDYSLACDAPLPMTFRLDPTPDPEPHPLSFTELQEPRWA